MIDLVAAKNVTSFVQGPKIQEEDYCNRGGICYLHLIALGVLGAVDQLFIVLKVNIALLTVRMDAIM